MLRMNKKRTDIWAVKRMPEGRPGLILEWVPTERRIGKCKASFGEGMKKVVNKQKQYK